MKYLSSLLCVFFLVSCSAVRVNYDYDKETDFTNYTTYNYYSDMETGLNELDSKRLLNLLDITLQIKGLMYSEEPDLLINITSESFQTARNTSVGVGLGGSGSNVGGGVSVGIPVGKRNIERRIQFDFVDSKKDELFWQAVSTSTFKENVTPVERDQKMAELIDKVFAKYPPKKRK